MKNTLLIALLIGVAVFDPISTLANNLVMENVSLSNRDAQNDQINIEFDVSWDNSWRENGDGLVFSDDNWDAVWVFAKYKVGSGDWAHCTLATSGHTAASGSTIENPSSSTDNRQTGIFMYRSSAGFGSNNWDDCKLKWNYGSDGVADDASVKIRVFGIEMCYVPEGSFYLGDGSSASTFEGTDDNPVQITSGETTVRMDGTYAYAGDATLQSGIKVDGDGGICTTGTGAIDNTDYPTGYKAFYVMKYNITQGQWVNFCNTLTSSQAAQRWYTDTNFRHGTLSGSHPNYASSRKDRALNFISIEDGMAYADWAGLRPMTELEYEKACRGTVNAVAAEYAWGTAVITSANSLTFSSSENGTETITTDVSAGACFYEADTSGGADALAGGDGGSGPLRVGIFATSSTDRDGSGATFYGIMEMSAHLYKRPVSFGSTVGRNFKGSHGDGGLTSDGYANITDWPGYADNSDSKNSGGGGSGYRAGSWAEPVAEARISYRQYMIYENAGRADHETCGYRACRSK